MIGSLFGTVIASRLSKTLLEVQGVGYWVYTGNWIPSGEVRIFTHQHVREDALELYGFTSLEQLSLFEKLISISGIGPKAGMALLGIGAASELHKAIEESNISYLTQAPGIGQKAAQKIILELKGKLVLGTDEGGAQSELTLALEQLGYKRSEITALLPTIPEGSIQQQLAWALQRL